MEPLSIVVISAAVGGVAGKFVDRAWDLGEKWLSSYLKDHDPKAREEAKHNTLDFLNQLAERVKILEQKGKQYNKFIEDSLNHPDFSILLQKAIISSAQTDDKQKHELLARLVSDRLTKEPESLSALCSKPACDAVSALNVGQLKILGLLTELVFQRPFHYNRELLKEWSNTGLPERLTQNLHVYRGLTLTYRDFLHLESLSCIRWNPDISDDYMHRPAPSDIGGLAFIFDYKEFSNAEVSKAIVKLWETEFGWATPTTVGQLIGRYVSDMLTNTTTPLNRGSEA
jgi:hypothetical protein